MTKVTKISSRKSDHININLLKDVKSGLSNGLEHYHFIHQALPEIDLEDIDLTVNVFNHQLAIPLLISCMTGGTQKAMRINKNLASAAQKMNIAMGLGSLRAVFDHPELIKTYAIRKWAPDILLFANLGAVQLNYGFSIEHCRQAVEMVEADGLFLHLNPLQEAIQREGNTKFSGLLKKIEKVCNSLAVPIIIKEVGWGISAKIARKLIDAGVSAIDIAGAGGTSWSQVEAFRQANSNQARLAATFINWGIPTAEALQQIHEEIPKALLFASGGIRSGLDIAKCIALGATLGGMAAPFLKTAALSVENTIEEINLIKKEISLTMFVTGSKSIEDIRNQSLVTY